MNISKILNQILVAAVAAFSLVGTAQAADGAAGGSFTSLVPLILIFVIFYFLLIRPQQKRVKEHKTMIEAIKKGDKVVTSGGIIGTVQDVKDDVLKIDIADGVRVQVKRDTIVSLTE